MNITLYNLEDKTPDIDNTITITSFTDYFDRIEYIRNELRSLSYSSIRRNQSIFIYPRLSPDSHSLSTIDSESLSTLSATDTHRLSIILNATINYNSSILTIINNIHHECQKLISKISPKIDFIKTLYNELTLNHNSILSLIDISKPIPHEILRYIHLLQHLYSHLSMIPQTLSHSKSFSSLSSQHLNAFPRSTSTDLSHPRPKSTLTSVINTITKQISILNTLSKSITYIDQTLLIIRIHDINYTSTTSQHVMLSLHIIPHELLLQINTKTTYPHVWTIEKTLSKLQNVPYNIFDRFITKCTSLQSSDYSLCTCCTDSFLTFNTKSMFDSEYHHLLNNCPERIILTDDQQLFINLLTNYLNSWMKIC